MHQHDTGLELPQKLQVLAEDRQPSFAHGGFAAQGDQVLEQASRLWHCKPELDELESVEQWLARGGKIIQC